MHVDNLTPWQHDHVFLGQSHGSNERKTWIVVAFTLAMMVLEIVGGSLLGSMALVADGWHMSTHAAALAIAALAYRFARIHAHSPAFSFGTGKLGELAAFASAIILAGISGVIAYDCALHLIRPQIIHFAEALPIAVLGLVVNLASAYLLHDDEGEADTNRRAAFVHVLADALTSVLAIAALLAGWYWGILWLDPLVGLVGAIVIAIWAWGLIRDAGKVLLDTVPDAGLAEAIRASLERDLDRVADLHLWRLGPGHYGLVVTIVTDAPQAPDTYKARLADLTGLSHITIEVATCPGS